MSTPQTALLAAFPATLNALLSRLPDELLHANEGGDSWSPFQIVAHLIDSEQQNWIQRAQLILASDEPPAFAKFNRDGHQRESESKTLAEMLVLFAKLRAENLKALADFNLQPSDLEKQGIHPAFGLVTLGNLLATWSTHDLTHLHQLARVLAYQSREAVGPWVAYLGVLKCEGHSASA